MSTEEKLKTAINVGNMFNTWGKLLVAIVVFVASASATYYTIYANSAGVNDNADTIELLRSNTNASGVMLLEKVMEEFDRQAERNRAEFETMSARSDKRYARAMAEADELHDDIDRQGEQILELTEKLHYLEGYLDGQRE